MSPISARSRRPAWVLTSMLSTSCRASLGASTGVLPRFTTVGTTPDLSSGLDGLVEPLPTHAPAPLPEGALRDPDLHQRGRKPGLQQSRQAHRSVSRR